MTIRFGQQIAEGLAEAWEKKKLIHRDIKTGNLWIDQRKTMLILDYGLASSPEVDRQLTNPGSFIGTANYTSPEQTSFGNADHRSDLFSLGIVLYQSLTGLLPFRGDTVSDVLQAVREHHPKSPSELDLTIPTAMSEVVMQLLQKDPEQRPQTAHMLLTMLDELDSTVASTDTRNETDRPDNSTAKMDAKSTELVQSPLASGRKRSWFGPITLTAVGTLLALLVGVWLFGTTTVLYLKGRAQLVIDIDDPTIEVRIKQDDVWVTDTNIKRSLVLTPVNGQIEVFEKNGIYLLTKKFELRRNRQFP